jgi:Fur family ferric uptake transcriptional regulator
MTPQRHVIADVMASLDPPITAERVHGLVVRQFPDINISTVYRTLEMLEEVGLVYHAHSHDGVAHYHFAHEPVHQHLVCLGCGTEEELDQALLEPLADELRRRYGFDAALGHSAIVGRCRECQRSAIRTTDE